MPLIQQLLRWQNIHHGGSCCCEKGKWGEKSRWNNSEITDLTITLHEIKTVERRAFCKVCNTRTTQGCKWCGVNLCPNSICSISFHNRGFSFASSVKLPFKEEYAKKLIQHMITSYSEHESISNERGTDQVRESESVEIVNITRQTRTTRRCNRRKRKISNNGRENDQEREGDRVGTVNTRRKTTRKRKRKTSNSESENESASVKIGKKRRQRVIDLQKKEDKVVSQVTMKKMITK